MRVNKMAMCLMKRGHELHLITNKLVQYTDKFKTVIAYQSGEQLRDAVKLHPDADLFHAHNEPSWFVTIVKEAFPHKKVILDVHDSMLLRRTEEDVEQNPGTFRWTADERNNMQLADGLVYVCKPMQDIVGPAYNITQPTAIIPNMVPRDFYRIDHIGIQRGIVYEGRIDLSKQLEKQWDFFEYSNYLPFAEECLKHGIPFHIYTARQNEELRKAYNDKCIMHPPLSYDKLIKEIGVHDWGLVGNNTKHEEWKNALPNKLFEYMAACLPIICFNADESWNFIKDYDIGIKVDSFEEIKKRWNEAREKRNNLIKCRQQFTLDEQMPKLEALYKEVLA